MGNFFSSPTAPAPAPAPADPTTPAIGARRKSRRNKTKRSRIGKKSSRS